MKTEVAIRLLKPWDLAVCTSFEKSMKNMLKKI